MWSCAAQRVHSTALHQLLLHQPGRRARVLQQLPSPKQYCTTYTHVRYCLLVTKCCADVLKRGDKRMWSYATQHVHGIALYQLLLRQPGLLLQQLAWGGVAPNDATREPGAFC